MQMLLIYICNNYKNGYRSLKMNTHSIKNKCILNNWEVPYNNHIIFFLKKCVNLLMNNYYMSVGTLKMH